MNISAIPVLSSYPVIPDKAVSGAARYIKKLLDGDFKTQFIVLSENLVTGSYVASDNVEVFPLWKKNSALPYFKVIKLLKKFKPPFIVVNFEFNMYGGILGLFGLLKTLFLIRCLGIKIVVVYHPALLSFKELGALKEHLGIQSDLLVWFYSFGMHIYSRLLVLFARYTVVFEQELKNRLNIKSSSIHVIPHMIYGEKENSKFTKKSKSKKLNILFFGFVVPYKGVDVLVEAFTHLDSQKFNLTVAGGKSPTSMNQKYYRKLVSRMKSTKGITHTGFVPNNDIASIINQADLIILPYKNLLASSGPLAWAISEGKPFLLSNLLKGYLLTQDINETMIKENLNVGDITFDLSPKSLAGKIEEVAYDNILFKKLQSLSRALNKRRRVENIIKEYHSVFSKTVK